MLKSISDYQKLPQIPQRTPEWYAKRQNLITASRTASLLHLNSYHSYNDLLQSQPDPTPKAPPDPITPENLKYYEVTPTTWGTLLEPVALKHLEQTTQSPIGELGLKVHDEYPFLGASPDGIQVINGKARLIEMKCPMQRQITYRVPLEYWVQTQICMAVWPEIDECLYAEYKFELTSEKPTDSKLPFGQLHPDQKVYWILRKTWTTVIKREPEWFRKILPQIMHFHTLKHAQTTTSATTSTTRRKRTRSQTRQRPTQGDLLPAAKISKLPRRRRRRNRRQLIVSNEDYVPPPHQQASKLPHLFSINRLTNFFREDPILDWLDAHQDEYLRDPTPFLDYYNQLNLQFKLSTISKVRQFAQSNQMTYRVLNASLNNLLDIPNYQELLLKLQYDCHLLEETQEAMERQIDIIFMGQLGIQHDKYTLWDTYDMLIRKDVFRLIFPEQRPQTLIDFQHELLYFQSKPHQIQYIPIKIKLTTLKLLSDGKTLSSSHRVDQLRIGAISPALIYDRQKKFGLIPKHDHDEMIHEGIQWLNQIDQVSLKDIYPNMKNKYDSQWKSAKVYLADEKEELTQISYLNVSTRQELHQMGITKISQLTPSIVSKLNNGSRIGNFIERRHLYLPRIHISAPVEVYLDFESVSSLDKRPGQIFLAGLLIKYYEEEEPELEFIQYLVDQLTQEEEKSLLEMMMEKLRSLGPQVPIFHWSQAEPNLLRKAGFELPDNCYWVDLYKHFAYENATIPGCYSYGLKDIATQLVELGEIETEWTQGLDGSQAMIMAWLADRRCQLEGTLLGDDEEIARICEYNYVDVKVMEEIRALL